MYKTIHVHEEDTSGLTKLLHCLGQYYCSGNRQTTFILLVLLPLDKEDLHKIGEVVFLGFWMAIYRTFQHGDFDFNHGNIPYPVDGV